MYLYSRITTSSRLPKFNSIFSTVIKKQIWLTTAKYVGARGLQICALPNVAYYQRKAYGHKHFLIIAFH
jgi:hypothetical protein